MASVNLFSAGGEAGFDEGWVKGSIEGSVGVVGAIDARLCHGIDLGIDVEAAAEAQAYLRLLVLGARGNVGVQAHAGVHGQVTLDPNIFERFGLTARVEAAAEVAARAQLEIALEADYVAELATQQIDDNLTLKLFLAFLREIRVGGGVMGKVAFCAMARAWAEVAGSLLDGKGFTIGAGWAVGLKGGAGMDYFMRIGFENPRRFFGTSVDLIVEEVVRELHRTLPPSSSFAIELFRLLAPVGLHTAYEVGQASVAQGLMAPEQLIRPFLEAFAEELQRYLVDKAAEYAVQAITKIVEEATLRLVGVAINSTQRETIKNAVTQLHTALADGAIALENLNTILSFATTVCEIVSPEMVQRVKQPYALLWTALAAGAALRQVGELVAQGQVAILGVGVEARPRLHPMPPVSAMPLLVRQEYLQKVPEFDGTNLTFDHAMDYLISVGIGPLLENHTPELSALLDYLYQATGLTPGNVVTFGIQGGVGGPVTETKLYQKLSTFIRGVVEDYIQAYIFDPFQAAANATPHARLYMDEVTRPTIELMISFVFDQLDAAVGNPSLLGTLDYLSRLQSGLSALLYKIVARNLTVLESIASNAVRENVVDAFAVLERTVRSDNAHVILTTALAHTEELLEQISSYVPALPGHTTLTPAQVTAIRTFIAEMLHMGQELMGENVFTQPRWDRRRRAIQKLLLSLDVDFDWKAKDVMKEAIDTMLQCAFVPYPDAIKDLFRLHLEMLSDQCGIALQRVPPALSKLMLALTLPKLDDKDNLSKKIMEAAQILYNAALQALQTLVEMIQQAAALAEAARQAIQNALQNALAALAAINPDTLKSDLVERGKQNLRLVGEELNVHPTILDPLVAGFGIALDTAMPIIAPLIEAALNPIKSGSFLGQALNDAISQIDATELVMAGSGHAFLDETAEKFTQMLERNIFSSFLPSDGSSPHPDLTIMRGGFTALQPVDFASVVFETVFSLINEEALLLPRLDQAYYEALRNSGEAQKPARQTQLNQAKAELEAVRGLPGTTIDISSPAPLIPDLRKTTLYGPAIPLSLRLRPAGQGWMRQGNARRVQVTSNGYELEFPTAAWTYDAAQKSLHLDTVLRAELGQISPGLNVLEVSVANDAGKRERRTVSFIVDVDGPPANTGVMVDLKSSQFDSPGSDHKTVADEYVAIRWKGDGRLDLKGWRVRDRVGHEYIFGDRSIGSGQVLRLHTGGDGNKDSDTDVYWGRRRAVWNNEGDLILLLDQQGTVRAQEIYGRLR